MWPRRRSAEKGRRAGSGELGEFEQPKSNDRFAAAPRKRNPRLQILRKHMAASFPTVIHKVILKLSAPLILSRDAFAHKPLQVAILLSGDHNLVGRAYGSVSARPIRSRQSGRPPGWQCPVPCRSQRGGRSRPASNFAGSAEIFNQAAFFFSRRE